jgi:ABC-type transport system involved in cytochrome bd biosynthesis fused ATPase/permease subunit
MRVAGLLLMLSGWVIVLTAVALLSSQTSRTAFLVCGLGVEVLGLIVCLRFSVREEGRQR